MSNPNTVFADLDEIVFETRNKEYGAYDLRKRYNKFLLRAAIIACVVFLFGVVSPKLYTMIMAGDAEEDTTTNVVIDMMDLPPPPSLEEEQPPPPEIDIPPPKISSVEFKVPVPKPDEEVLEDETIEEMEKIEESNPGHETVEGDSVGYDFGDIEGDGEVVAEIEVKDEDPDPNAFIMVEKEPQPVNMDDIKKLIGYPQTAKEAEIEGRVVLRILVGKNGQYERHIVVKNPHKILTKAVTDQIKGISFTPAIQAGNPVKMWVTIPFEFKLMR